MGLYSASRRSAGDSYKANDPVQSTNPNPDVFDVQRVTKIGIYFLSVVVYPNCTNFEGRKILLTRRDPRNMDRLDPHFSKDIAINAGLIARFEPTEFGWNCGECLAKQLSRTDFYLKRSPAE